MAVRQLDGADVEVLPLDRDLYNTSQPQLYQVATGGLDPGAEQRLLAAFTETAPQPGSTSRSPAASE
jgi:NADH:ubiquinone reductase (H+-translocating)